MTEVTSEGKRLIEQWTAAQKEVDYAKSRLNSAECALLNTRQAVAKWMLPDDAKPGEKIAVWHGDSLVQVEVAAVPGGDHIVTVRSRGKHAYELGRVA